MINRNIETTQIKLSQIKTNPKNIELDSVTNDESISLLAESIANAGLMQPLVVYKDKANSYVLVSGHKRLEALKRLVWDDAPCVVINKPKHEDIEQILLLYANRYRQTPEEINKIVEIAKREWNNMDAEIKKIYKEKYKSKFIKRHKDVPEYKANPSEFTRNYFSAQCDFIREVTGLTSSNATVKRMITDILDKELDREPKAEKTKKESKPKAEVSNKTKLLKTIETLQNVIVDLSDEISEDANPKDRNLLKELALLSENIDESREIIEKLLERRS